MTAGKRFVLEARAKAVQTALREVAAWNDVTIDPCHFDDHHALRHAADELKSAIDMLIADRDAALLGTLERIAMIGGTVDVRA